MPDDEEISKTAEWLDEKMWMTLFKPLKERPRRAGRATLIFDCLIELIEGGEEGRHLALCALEDAIRILYGFTRDAKLAYEYYRLCLKTGDLAEDQREWLMGALERTCERARMRVERDRLREETAATKTQPEGVPKAEKVEDVPATHATRIRSSTAARKAAKKASRNSRTKKQAA